MKTGGQLLLAACSWQAFCGLAAGAEQDSSAFALPDAFLGTWVGEPEFNIIGPYAEDSYTFLISKSPKGDYLFSNNIFYDSESIGYQRFYVEGYGETAGNLWYCGNISHYFDGYGVTGDGRLNGYKAVSYSAEAATFCLDTDNPEVLAGFNNPFQSLCSGCDCSNWTIAYDAASDTLSTQLSMGAAEGETHSKHLWSTLTRTGPAAEISDEEMPGHGEDFSCDFSDGGRDTAPIDAEDPLKSGCPFFKHTRGRPLTMGSTPHAHPPAAPAAATTTTAATAATAAIAASATTYEHCYVLNELTGYRLEWTLDAENEVLHCRVSVPAEEGSTWAAIGFRPLSRSADPTLIKEGSGHHMDFGMQGADIVVGSANEGLRSLYAELYTGPPVPDSSLKVTDTDVLLQMGRLSVSFTRPLVGGFLAANYNSTASIVSFDADIIWAIGSDAAGTDEGNPSTCDYHDNRRGMRYVDWESPEIAMYDSWKC
jgi:hypothetical protein